MKEFINYVLDSNIANDHCGAWKIFLDNRCACPELLVILFEEMNLIGGGNRRKNRIGFPGNDERLTFTKGAERVTYRHIYDKHSHIVSTRWKYSKTLQLTSSVRKTGMTEVSRRRGQDIH